MPVEVDERWIEVDYGELEGRPSGTSPPSCGHDGGPTRRSGPPAASRSPRWACASRDACDELFARPGAGRVAEADVVVVSHVSPIKAAVAWALGTGDEVTWRLHLATASITRIGWGADGPVLHGYNATVLPGPVS